MKESSQFNVFHQFAGCFVPHGLLSIRNLSASAKICYALLAQQSNARGMAQLNLPLLATSIGESERLAVCYLVELEESGLIESARGNVNKEDVRISFPRHPWQTRNTGLIQATTSSSAVQAAGKRSRNSSPSNLFFRNPRRRDKQTLRKSLPCPQDRKGRSVGSDARARATHSRLVSSSLHT